MLDPPFAGAATLSFQYGEFVNKVNVLCVFQASELVNGSPSPSDTSTFTVTQVDVTVLDENDNSPEFDKSEYSVTIPEDMVDRTPLATPIIEVTDRDQVWASK